MVRLEGTLPLPPLELSVMLGPPLTLMMYERVPSVSGVDLHAIDAGLLHFDIREGGVVIRTDAEIGDLGAGGAERAGLDVGRAMENG